MTKKIKQMSIYSFCITFAIFIVISHFANYAPGLKAGKAFWDSVKEMALILPCAFALIALCEVWVKRETIEYHLGHDAGIKKYFWAILMGGMTIGGMYLAFPVAYTLFKKGASLKVIFSFLGFAGFCRIPMTIFEITCLGWKFTLIRIVTGGTFIIAYSCIMGGILHKQGYQIKE